MRRRQLLLFVCLFILCDFNEGKGSRRRPIYRQPSPPSGKTFQFPLSFTDLLRIVPGSNIKKVDIVTKTETTVCPDFTVPLDNINTEIKYGNNFNQFLLFQNVQDFFYMSVEECKNYVERCGYYEYFIDERIISLWNPTAVERPYVYQLFDWSLSEEDADIVPRLYSFFASFDLYKIAVYQTYLPESVIKYQSLQVFSYATCSSSPIDLHNRYFGAGTIYPPYLVELKVNHVIIFDEVRAEERARGFDYNLHIVTEDGNFFSTMYPRRKEIEPGSPLTIKPNALSLKLPPTIVFIKSIKSLYIHIIGSNGNPWKVGGSRLLLEESSKQPRLLEELQMEQVFNFNSFGEDISDFQMFDMDGKVFYLLCTDRGFYAFNDCHASCPGNCFGTGANECCPDDCEDCFESADNCIGCEPGFWLQTSDRSCQKCQPQCATCESFRKCLTCKSRGILGG